MSTEEQTAETDAPELAPEAFPGAQLRARREAAKLSQDEVARELRMTVSKVRALEADDYDRLHSDTFVRGYLRTYAKLLGLDPDEMLQVYRLARRQSGLAEEPEESPLKINVPDPTRSVWKFVLWILVLLAGIWALSVWFLGNKQEPSVSTTMVDPVAEMNTPESDPQASVIDDERAPVDVEPSPQRESDNNAEGVAAEDGPAVASGAQAATDVERAEPSNNAVEPLAATEVVDSAASLRDPEVLDQLRLSFSEECWVEVTDSRGDVLEADLIQPGRALSLSGEAPFTVKLGNAAAAQVELNGEPFEFVPPNRGRLMTLTVN